MIEKQLSELKEFVSAHDITAEAKDTELFGGADVCVVFSRPPETDGFYPDAVFVVTPYARELSWLVFRLKGIFRESLDYFSKYSFYGRLAARANKSLADKTVSMKKLLDDVLEEALAMAREMKGAGKA